MYIWRGSSWTCRGPPSGPCHCPPAQGPPNDIFFISGCSWFKKGATCIIEDLLLILVGVDLDVPDGVLLEELLKIVSDVSSVAHQNQWEPCPKFNGDDFRSKNATTENFSLALEKKSRWVCWFVPPLWWGWNFFWELLGPHILIFFGQTPQTHKKKKFGQIWKKVGTFIRPLDFLKIRGGVQM